MISNWAIANKIPLAQVSQLEIQNSILSTLVENDLLKPEQFTRSLPTTARTVYKQLGIWKEDLFDEYACCVNHHLHPQSFFAFFDHNCDLVRLMFCEETTFGKTASKTREVCAQPVKRDCFTHWQNSFRPVKLAPYRGITRCLRVLFRRKWFVDNLDHWKHLPDISPALGDLYHGAR